MIEIKFRAWDKKLKIMKIVKELDFTYFKTIPKAPQGQLVDIWLNDDDLSYTGNEIELLRYTGLKDKNIKEIYEGDIYHQGDKNIKYIVVWHDTGFKGKQIGSSSYAGLSYFKEKIEVIGNIYENPELLAE